MEIIEKRFRLNFKIVINPVKNFSGFKLIKAATILKINNVEIILLGSSCSENIIDGKNRAIGELMERIWARFDVQNSIAINNKLMLSSINDKQVGEVDIADICLDQPPNQDGLPKMDSTGFSFHPVRKKAVTHAAFELLERHFFGQAWYLNDICWHRLASYQVNKIVTLDVYIVPALQIPLSIAVCWSSSCLAMGVKLANNQQDSIKGAINEAVMVFEDHAENDTLIFQNTYIKERAFLNKNSNYIKSVIEHINKKKRISCDSNFNLKEMSLKKILDIKNIDYQNINFATLNTFSGNCIKALCPNLNTLQMWRNGNKFQIPIDPLL